jgi:membrane carboxypeptidase/penicillin-binding protein
VFVRIVAFGGVALVVALLAFCGWFFLYSGDLPQLQRAAQYGPDVPRKLLLSCANMPVMVIPYAAIAPNLRHAILCAEVGPGTATLRLQLTRRLLCDQHSRILERELKELRLANQLRLHFNSEQLLTIYANTVYLGDVSAALSRASQHYFAKSASQLSLAEAAKAKSEELSTAK